MSVEKLDDLLKKQAEEIIDHRIEQWAKYYFEKELLPGLKSEIKERLVVQLLTCMEKWEGINLNIYFKPDGKTK